MREAEPLKQEDKIEILKLQQHKIGQILEGRIEISKGHTLFEFNLLTKELTIVQFDSEPELSWEQAKRKDYGTSRKITRNETSIYVAALNKKNALKKIRKHIDW